MKKNTIWILIIGLLCFTFGLAIGTGLGMQKGQYMLFEGLNTAFNGANINLTIDINETQMVDRVTENMQPILNGLILQTNCTITQKGYCAIKCYENGDLIPCENFTFDEHFCYEGICEVNGICPTYYEELRGKTVKDCMEESIEKQMEKIKNETEY